MYHKFYNHNLTVNNHKSSEVRFSEVAMIFLKVVYNEIGFEVDVHKDESFFLKPFAFRDSLIQKDKMLMERKSFT